MRRSIQAIKKSPSGVASMIGKRPASLTSFNVRADVNPPLPSSMAKRMLARVLSPLPPGIRPDDVGAVVGVERDSWSVLFTLDGFDFAIHPLARRPCFSAIR